MTRSDFASDGRTDIEFKSKDDGYSVLRHGKLAQKLSEGEKTAIAFLYFVTQLKDQDFAIADGIIVIDDPISSLDSSPLDQAFYSKALPLSRTRLMPDLIRGVIFFPQKKLNLATKLDQAWFGA